MSDFDTEPMFPPPSNASGELGRASLDAKANGIGAPMMDSLVSQQSNASGDEGRAAIEAKDQGYGAPKYDSLEASRDNTSGQLGAASLNDKRMPSASNVGDILHGAAVPVDNTPTPITGSTMGSLSAPSSATSSPATNRVYSRFPDSSAGSAFDAAGAKRDSAFDRGIANAENRLNGPSVRGGSLGDSPSPRAGSLDSFDRGATVARVSGAGSASRRSSGASSARSSGAANTVQSTGSAPAAPRSSSSIASSVGAPMPRSAVQGGSGITPTEMQGPRSFGGSVDVRPTVAGQTVTAGDARGTLRVRSTGSQSGSSATAAGGAAAPMAPRSAASISVQRGGSGPARISGGGSTAMQRGLQRFLAHPLASVTSFFN